MQRTRRKPIKQKFYKFIEKVGIGVKVAENQIELIKKNLNCIMLN